MASRNQGNQHVVKAGNGWGVKQAGSNFYNGVHSTQREAIRHAESIARVLGSDTKVHGRNGKIRAGNSYGNDPFPPRDKR